MVQEMSISQSQKRVLLACAEGFTNEDYRRYNQVDRDQAYKEIQEMVSLEIIMPAQASGRGAVYHVSPDMREARAFFQQRLPQLREILDARGFLTNADYRKLYQVQRVRATREMRRLVQDGYLTLQGKGRGAHYIAGKKLAAQYRLKEK